MTYTDKDAAIRALSGVKPTQSDIISFVRDLSVDAKGSVTVLYSGKVGGSDAWRIVSQMGGDIRYLGNTVASKVLESDAFLAKVAQAFDDIV